VRQTLYHANRSPVMPGLYQEILGIVVKGRAPDPELLRRGLGVNSQVDRVVRRDGSKGHGRVSDVFLLVVEHLT
jgi:hypothetical protein